MPICSFIEVDLNLGTNVLKLFRCYWILPPILKSLLSAFIKRNGLRNAAKSLWHGDFFAGFWCFWQTQNSSFFNNKNTSYSKLWECMAFFASLQLKGNDSFYDISISDLYQRQDIFIHDRQLFFCFFFLFIFLSWYGFILQILLCFCLLWRMSHSPLLQFFPSISINSSSFIQEKKREKLALTINFWIVLIIVTGRQLLSFFGKHGACYIYVLQLEGKFQSIRGTFSSIAFSHLPFSYQ